MTKYEMFKHLSDQLKKVHTCPKCSFEYDSRYVYQDEIRKCLKFYQEKVSYYLDEQEKIMKIRTNESVMKLDYLNSMSYQSSCTLDSLKKTQTDPIVRKQIDHCIYINERLRNEIKFLIEQIEKEDGYK